MKNIFSFQRFFKLFSKHTREHYHTYLIAVAVLIGILTLMLGTTAYFGNGRLSINVQGAYFSVFLLLSGTIFTSMVFADLGDKKRSIPALTLPVSHFERFLVGWIYSYLIFQVIFVMCFFMIDLIVIKIGDINPLVKNDLLNFGEDRNKFLIAFLIFGLMHGATLLGAIFFEKLHFIKTAFAVFITLICFQVVNIPIVNYFFLASARMQPLFAGVVLRGEIKGQSIYIKPMEQSYIIVIYMVIAVTIVLWAAAFFKLKEKQV
ncbi:hypothetical protein H7F33_12325 [Pedobacter sp. PAMC26386]|nr:hypothetical protein H7F33_12325 [Pedobacter sp. PAMC26386]